MEAVFTLSKGNRIRLRQILKALINKILTGCVIEEKMLRTILVLAINQGGAVFSHNFIRII